MHHSTHTCAQKKTGTIIACADAPCSVHRDIADNDFLLPRRASAAVNGPRACNLGALLGSASAALEARDRRGGFGRSAPTPALRGCAVRPVPTNARAAGAVSVTRSNTTRVCSTGVMDGKDRRFTRGVGRMPPPQAAGSEIGDGTRTKAPRPGALAPMDGRIEPLATDLGAGAGSVGLPSLTTRVDCGGDLLGALGAALANSCKAGGRNHKSGVRSSRKNSHPLSSASVRSMGSLANWCKLVAASGSSSEGTAGVGTAATDDNLNGLACLMLLATCGGVCTDVTSSP